MNNKNCPILQGFGQHLCVRGVLADRNNQKQIDIKRLEWHRLCISRTSESSLLFRRRTLLVAITSTVVRRNHDVHLIVNHMAFSNLYDEADSVYGKTARKVELIKDYFDNHDHLRKQYNDFFTIDEMCGMDVSQINELFMEMSQDNCEFSLIGLTMPCLRQDTMIQALEGNPETSILFF